MKIVLVFFLVLLLCGCKSSFGPCYTDLSQLQKVVELPETLVSSYRDDIQGWYKYENGDYFYCKGLVDEATCGINFELSFLQADGTYKTEEIMCMS